MKRRSGRGSVSSAIIPILTALTTVVLLGSVFVYLAEHNRDNINTFWDAVWYSVVTMTTVGYGDIVPRTVLGRIAGMFVMLSGISVVSLLTATISSIFVEQRIMENQGLRQIKLKGHTIICGWNQRLDGLLQTLDAEAREKREGVVLINEMPPERMEETLSGYSNLNLKYVYGDYTKEPTLSRANLKDARAVILIPDMSMTTVPRDDKTLPAALAVKATRRDIKVYAHIIDKENLSHLRRAGVDDVIISDEHVGYLLASEIVSPGISQAVAALLNSQNGARLQRVAIPAELVGKQFSEVQDFFKSRKDSIAIGLVIEEDAMKLSDVLSSDYSAIDSFIERKFKAAGIDMLEKGGLRLNLNPPSDHVIKQKEDAIVIR